MAGDELRAVFGFFEFLHLDRWQAGKAQHFAHPVVNCHHQARHSRLHGDDRAVEPPAEVEVHMRGPGAPLIGIEEGAQVERHLQTIRTRIGDIAEHLSRAGVKNSAIGIRLDLHVEVQELILDNILRLGSLGVQRDCIDDAIVIGAEITRKDRLCLADLDAWQLLHRCAHVVRREVD
ncbi:hypothetical protein D9M72_398740 [compost metagenome]